MHTREVACCLKLSSDVNEARLYKLYNADSNEEKLCQLRLTASPKRQLTKINGSIVTLSDAAAELNRLAFT